jgi:hypothetical protein
MIPGMPPAARGGSEGVRFVPRLTLLLLAGFALFLLVAFLYALPALIEPLPAGAIESYRQERVIARLEGKLAYLLAGSLLAAGLLGMRLLRPR